MRLRWAPGRADARSTSPQRALSGRPVDARVQLAWGAAILVGAVAGGEIGLAVAAAAGAALAIATRCGGRVAAAVRAVLPLALVIALLDLLTGRPDAGVRAATRLLVLVGFAAAFARAGDPERLAGALLALRVPYPAAFALVTGARWVPLVGREIAELRDGARARGIGAGGRLAELRSWRLLVVPLLVSSIRRGLTLAESMEARGFSGAARRSGSAPSARDALLIAGALAYAAAIIAGHVLRGS